MVLFGLSSHIGVSLMNSSAPKIPHYYTHFRSKNFVGKKNAQIQGKSAVHPIGLTSILTQYMGIFLRQNRVRTCVLWLCDSGYAGTFQDKMHISVTALVVMLSILSLTVIIIAGIKSRDCRSYGIRAAAAFVMMLVGAFGMKIVPAGYFGVVERFSVFAATGFNAALGLHLFLSKGQNERTA